MTSPAGNPKGLSCLQAPVGAGGGAGAIGGPPGQPRPGKGPGTRPRAVDSQERAFGRPPERSRAKPGQQRARLKARKDRRAPQAAERETGSWSWFFIPGITFPIQTTKTPHRGRKASMRGFQLRQQESNLRWGSQSPLPYRLAMAHYKARYFICFLSDRGFSSALLRGFLFQGSP